VVSHSREWIDLQKLDPVDWSAVSTNFSNSVAHLQLPFREGHTAREDMLTARLQCEPPADTSLADDHVRGGEDTSWYPTGDENAMTAGDTQFVDCPLSRPTDIPRELVDHADDKHPTEYEPSRAELDTPPAYDKRTDRAMVPYGRPRDGDTYTRDGNTYYTVGGPSSMPPMELLTRWLEQLPGQLSGTNVRAAYDDYVRYSRPVVSPIPHHNRWEQAATQHAAMDISRDGVIHISTPSDTRDSRDCVVPYRADPRSEVYDGGGTRLLTYTPNPHDERPVRHFDIHIERYKQQSVPAASEVEAASEVYDGEGGYPPQDTPNSYDEQQAAQSPD